MFHNQRVTNVSDGSCGTANPQSASKATISPKLNPAMGPRSTEAPTQLMESGIERTRDSLMRQDSAPTNGIRATSGHDTNKYESGIDEPAPAGPGQARADYCMDVTPTISF